jgi:hypothetical protein
MPTLDPQSARFAWWEGFKEGLWEGFFGKDDPNRLDGVFNLPVQGPGPKVPKLAKVPKAPKSLKAPCPPKKTGFSNAKLGNAMHGRFEDALTKQTGTLPEDWFMRTKPGQTGVDATYIGPRSRYPGFRYAELKPYSPGTIPTFGNQLGNWNLTPGLTQLWFYNQNGVIGSSGFNF